MAAIGTAFVIGKTPTGETLFATAGHNIPDTYGGGESNLVVVLPKKDGVTGLQGFTVSGVSIAESSSDMVLIVATIDETVEIRKQLTLGMEIPMLDENCLVLGYSTMSIWQEGFV